MRIKRRFFVSRGVTLLSVATAGCVFPVGCRFSPTRPLSDLQRRNLEAATSRILPSDDSPGAREANVVGFIEKHLTDYDYRTERELIGIGLNIMDSLAIERYGDPFVMCDESDQDVILTHIQSQETTVKGFPASYFFERLVALTLEGFLGDPIHGGNKDCVGWTFIGYEPTGPKPGHCSMAHKPA